MTKKSNTLVLGIETSCDDTSFAILKDGSPPQVLAHYRFGQEEVLKRWGGVVPEIAARNHLEKIPALLDIVFDKAKVSIDDIDFIAVTAIPGLLGPLLTGLNAAKSLSLIYHKPIIPVNHLYAHLEAIHLSKDIAYPYLGLLVSGGHSLFMWVKDESNFEILGSTIDDAAGEAFDKGAKLLGLGYPGGHIIDQLSKWGDENRFKFPIGLKSSADCRLSFSGLKTALRVFIEKNNILQHKPTSLNEYEKSSQEFYDVCASYQKSIIKALALKMRYAIKKVKDDKHVSSFPIIIGGGVACNSLIQNYFKEKYKNIYCVKPEFCTDNGAMIANYALRNITNAVSYPQSLELDARGRFINKKDFI